MSESTAYEYLTRLNYFKNCISNKSDITWVVLSIKINKNAYDPYYVSEYSSFLRNNSSISTLALKQLVVILKNFLTYRAKGLRQPTANYLLDQADHPNVIIIIAISSGFIL
jgi:hypothetical protein